MKVSRPREDREFDQAQRALAAQRLKDDELVQAWFDREQEKLTRDMLSTEISEDEKRRNCLLQIRALRELRKHIDAEASLGKKALEALEARNGR